ncbi:MAG: YabP/YqfC family sporulation protein, partial [Clostridia bacterium]|nr:YabP/YqfC family sporulation protein [Clostridia bacterium]
MQNETVPSVFTLEQQKKLTMTGVESVESFSPTQIVLRVAGK